EQKNSDIANGRLKKDAPAAQLYNLSKDPSQSKNIILEHPEIAAKLRKRLAAIKAQKISRPPNP
ncbi:hypothetical protein N9Z45_02125, partial [Akkermansiaceae bacterium]|nr:hypothetical protein [Akkermansiaceae bacterium]